MHTHTACSVLRNKKLKVVFNFRKKNFPLILKHDFRSKILELTLTKFHLSWPISKMWSVFFSELPDIYVQNFVLVLSNKMKS